MHREAELRALKLNLFRVAAITLLGAVAGQADRLGRRRDFLHSIGTHEPRDQRAEEAANIDHLIEQSPAQRG